MSDVRIVHELTPAQVDDLVALYQTAWWSVGRVRGDVEVMLGGCLPCGVVDGAGRLVGFARAISDGVYKALVCDVIVAEQRRGEGLGERIIDTLLGHPRVARCAHVELYCLPALIPFYERWGFTRDLGEVTFMRLTRSATSVSRTAETAV
jgi:GNAT superfamily N-acetyltransferase